MFLFSDRDREYSSVPGYSGSDSRKMSPSIPAYMTWEIFHKADLGSAAACYTIGTWSGQVLRSQIQIQKPAYRRLRFSFTHPSVVSFRATTHLGLFLALLSDPYLPIRALASMVLHQWDSTRDDRPVVSALAKLVEEGRVSVSSSPHSLVYVKLVHLHGSNRGADQSFEKSMIEDFHRKVAQSRGENRPSLVRLRGHGDSSKDFNQVLRPTVAFFTYRIVRQ
ncbi:hypothetical protein SISNIDRAFT_492153 [Sistotremastrum niveocremeum HHB9708]|uniref:Uncharacterized protein n=1 Tax=Sistotremastrum niveocremeum HHB9708 TaxID=1314777 RepID=A0A165ABU9_9AGAM|nr:hypothetical protein SISNIDRAFT_492153 [Sistotremastrum niveocremeum HHB9708]